MALLGLLVTDTQVFNAEAIKTCYSNSKISVLEFNSTEFAFHEITSNILTLNMVVSGLPLGILFL